MSNVKKLPTSRIFREQIDFDITGKYTELHEESLAPARDRSNLYCHINYRYQPAYEHRFLFTDAFQLAHSEPYTDESEWVYLARAFDANQEWCYINERGVPPQTERYFRASCFRLGHAAVELFDEGSCHINWLQQPVYEERFDDVTDMKRAVDTDNTPYLYADANLADRHYRIIIRRAEVTIVPLIQRFY